MAQKIIISSTGRSKIDISTFGYNNISVEKAYVSGGLKFEFQDNCLVFNKMTVQDEHILVL